MPEDLLPGLKPILAEAMKQSPQMLLREIEIARKEANLIETRAERLPQVSGNLRYDSNQTAATSSASVRDSGLFYSLSANQTVFQWGALKHRTDISHIEIAVAEKNYVEAYRALAVQIRQAYVELIASNAQLKRDRYEISLKEAELATVRDRLKIGTASPLDVAARELDLNEAQLALERKLTEFDANRRRLSRLAGLKPDIPAEEIPVEIPLPKYDAALSAQLLADLLRDGAKGSFRAQVAELNIKEADLRYRIARVRLLPRFSTGISHSRESSTSATPTSVSQTAITRDTLEVRGDWSIFDGFATKGYKLEAKAEKRSWERQLEIDSEAVMDEAQKLQRLVGIEARALEFANQRHAGAANYVQTVQDDLKKSGSTSESAVKAAILGLYTADWNVAITRANYLNDWCAFVSLVADDPVLNNLSSRYVRANR